MPVVLLVLVLGAGFAPADGFRVEVRLGEKRVPRGKSVPLHPAQAALIRVPPVGDALDLFPIGGVAYRPWIFSNPVHIRG